MTIEQMDDRDVRRLLDDLYLGSRPAYADDVVQRAVARRQRPAWTFVERWIPVYVVTERVPVRAFPGRALAILVTVGLIVALAAAIFVGTRPRLPSPFGLAGNGLVAHADGGDIYTIDPLTGERQLVVGGWTWDTEPRWSSDGTRIAFLRGDPGSFRIAAVGVDGTGLVVSAVGFDEVDRDGIAWSPDGRTIALVAGPERHTEINLFDSRTGEVRRLDAPGFLYLQALWRPPDGQELLYYGSGPSGDGLFLVSIDDGSTRRVPTDPGLTGEFRLTGWTPDGQRVLFHNGESTHVTDVDTGTTTVLPVIVGHPSNDGTRVAGWVDHRSRLGFCVIPISGGRCVRTGDVNMNLFSPGTHMSLQWLPNDEWILATSDDGADAVLLDPDGGQAVRPPWLPPTTEVVQRIAPP